MLARTIVLLAPLLLSGCLYAPLDLGLEGLGELDEVTVVAGDEDSEDKILMLRIDGVITDTHEDGSVLGGGGHQATTALVHQALDRARKDPNIKGVILRINSPGGGVTASDVIFNEIKRFRSATGLPVVAFFLDTAASGGYYVAQAADAIVASPTTITGSIGVIAIFPELSGLGEKVGVKVKAITSGPHKDTGSMFRPMRKEELALMQSLIDSMYGRFLEVIEQGRKAAGLTPEELRAAADGRVYTAEEAKELKLVDEVGYFDRALGLVQQKAQLTLAPHVVVYQRRVWGGSAPTLYSQPQAQGLLRISGEGGAVVEVLRAVSPRRSGPVLQYRWIPGRK